MLSTIEKKPLPSGVPAVNLDASLLLARLEDNLFVGREPEQVQGVLRRQALWQKLATVDRLRWAQLAQMAELPAVARAVLEAVHQQDPTCPEAWMQHLELLQLLGRRQAWAALLERARPFIGPQADPEWLEQAAPNGAVEEDLSAAFAPFEQRHRQDEQLRRFMRFFAGREECFARQWADRSANRQGYVPERRPLGPSDIDEHLRGRKTYGIYLLRTDNRVRLAVLDADLKKKLRGVKHKPAQAAAIRREAAYMISRLKELSQAAGAGVLVEFSGSKGYHFWYFFEQAIEASAARAALARLVKMVLPDLAAFDLEVFPKQDQHGGKGLGNLVKLPLGVHRLSGKRSFFIDCADRSLAAQMRFLETIRYCDTDKFLRLPAAEVVPHPRWQKRAERYPALRRLQTCCPPLAQVMGLCLEGGRLSLREEKILYQTIGFLPDAADLLHYLLARLEDYNPHLVNYSLSRLRGTPLGCRRIHQLLGFTGRTCRFSVSAGYAHPLLHIEGWHDPAPLSEKVVDLNSSLTHLKSAILQVERFLK